MQRSSSSRHLMGLVVAPVVTAFPIQINPVTVKGMAAKGASWDFRWLKYVVTMLCLKLRFIPKWSSGEAPFLAQASATRATSSASRRCSWRIYHNSMRWPRSVISHKRLYSVAHLAKFQLELLCAFCFPFVSLRSDAFFPILSALLL